MRRVSLIVVGSAIACLALGGGGCGPVEEEGEKRIRSAEIRGSLMASQQCIEEAISRAAPFVARLEEVGEHATFVFEEGPLATNLQFRNWWFECKRIVPEIIEPAKTTH